MFERSLAVAIALTAALGINGAAAFDDAKYPDLTGQWVAVRIPGVKGQPAYDPTKPWGLGQEAPLTPEYLKVLEASLADQAAGGAGLDRDYICMPPGMPRMMNVYGTMEVLVMPDTTYMLLSFLNDTRRIYTDGRDWPVNLEGAYAGYSIGRWIDEDGDGRYDVLEIETRNLKGPRTYDASGIPFHADGQTVIKERIYGDKTDPNLLYDEITSIDHALTRPWTVLKKYSRKPDPRPVWRESVCADDNNHVEIAKEGYMRSAEGLLMPTRKNQPPPDLKYFNRTAK